MEETMFAVCLHGDNIGSLLRLTGVAKSTSAKGLSTATVSPRVLVRISTHMGMWMDTDSVGVLPDLTSRRDG